MLGYIYSITNRLDGKTYIGQTRQTPKARWAAHAKCKRTYISRAIQKYGIDNFEFGVIATYDAEDIRAVLNKAEKHYIALYDSISPSGYNLTSGGHSTEFAEDVIRRIATASTGRKHPPRSESCRQRLREANKGHKASDETRAKISAKVKGLKKSDEARVNISKGLKGKPKSAAAIRKNSEAHKGKKRSEESIKRMIATNTGRKRSPEACERIREGRRAQLARDILERTNSDAQHLKKE